MNANSLVETVMKLGGGLLLPAGRRARLSILGFHSVSEDDWGLGHILPQELDAIMKFISTYFTVLSLEEAVQRLTARDLPSRSVVVTFDDGYVDNVEIALPILLRHGLSATFFVVTGTLDGGLMWNDQVFEAIRQCKRESLDMTKVGLGCLSLRTRAERVAAFEQCIIRLKYLPLDRRRDRVEALVSEANAEIDRKVMMDREDIRRLSSAGMSIGAHTVNHPILSSLDNDRAEEEIAASKRELEGIVGQEVKFFAYPNGFPGKDFLPHHVAMVRRLGFLAAVTTSPGTARHSTDRYQLPRFTPWDRAPGKFGIRLLLNGRTNPIILQSTDGSAGG